MKEGKNKQGVGNMKPRWRLTLLSMKADPLLCVEGGIFWTKEGKSWDSHGSLTFYLLSVSFIILQF